MEWWHAVVLGLVEGITEYLPISSTGHLILTSALLGPRDAREQRDAVATFEIAIQGGAILAVVGLYWNRVLQMLRGLVGRDTAGRRLLLPPRRGLPASGRCSARCSTIRSKRISSAPAPYWRRSRSAACG